MGKIIQPAARGVSILLSLGGEKLGGQMDATLIRGSSPIQITNKINADWEEYIPGIKNWKVSCSGIFIKDKKSFDILENAFMSNDKIQVEITDGVLKYAGMGLITSFPLSATYKDSFVYKLEILGTGELKSTYVTDSTE